MRPTELYAIQLELECKQILPSGRLGRVPCDNPDDLSLISAVRFLDGSGEFMRLREDGTADIEAVVQRLSVDDLLARPRSGSVGGLALRRNFAGRTGVFAQRPDAARSPLAERDGRQWVVKVHGEVVSRAVSARENDRAAEVACETVREFRRRGYARQVCAAWAREVVESGRVGFYSYDFENTASAALAASLDVAPQFDVAAFDLPEA